MRRRRMARLRGGDGVGDDSSEIRTNSASKHVVREQRRTAIGHERQRDTGQRNDTGDAADDDERLKADERGQPGGQQLFERMARAYGDAQTRRDDEEERDEDRRRSGKTQLFTDRSEDEVGFDPGHLVRPTEAESGARQTAFGHREGAFDDLESLALGVLPRVDPRLDPRLHVIEPLIADVRAAREQQQSDQQVGRAFGGDPHHRDEHREEQERRSEVSLHDENDQRDAPRETDGAEVLRLGQVQRPELEAAHAQQFSVFDEVRREEDGECDLRDLTRLEAQAGETDPDAGTTHRCDRGRASTATTTDRRRSP